MCLYKRCKGIFFGIFIKIIYNIKTIIPAFNILYTMPVYADT